MRRPRAISVVAWTWIVLGVLLSVGAVLQAISAVSEPADSSISTLLEAAVMLAVGLTGLASAIGLLALNARSRDVLELLTWVYLAYMMWLTFAPLPRFIHIADGSKVILATLLAGQLTFVLWVVGLSVLLVAIRSRAMRSAVAPA